MEVRNSKVDASLALQDVAGIPFQKPVTAATAPAAPVAATPASPAAELDLDDHLTKLVGYFEEAEETTQDARKLAERDRDYYDNDQWTPEELAILRKRKQPPLTINYVSRKVETLRGYERRMRSDPKAYPRNPDDEQTSNAATDALRYVGQANDFDVVRSSVHENLLIEGFGGADVVVETMPNGEQKVSIQHVPWDRLVYDPHSRLSDFSDTKYRGIVIWMDESDATAAYPGFEDAISETFRTSGNETYGDRPKTSWCDSKRKRVRVVQMHYKYEGEWMVATYTKGGFLSEPVVSPYVDKYGQSACSLIMRSAYIDRQNNRYGAVRGMISLQDEINKRRSKALHLLSVRQTFGNASAIADTQKARTELAKPDGHVEMTGGSKFGEDFGILPTGDLAAGQVQLYQMSVQELERQGPNAAMAGKGSQSQSGRAWEAQQQAGAVEMEPLVDELRQWTRDVYEAAWMRIRQFWTDETWVRVTDDDRNIKFVGLNKQVTLGDKLEKLLQQSPQEAKAMAQQLGIQSPYDPKLKEVVEVENDVSGLDVDIIIEEGPAIATLQSEQFQILADLAQKGMAIPPKAIIQASSIKPDTKRQILDEMEQGAQMPPEVQKQMEEMQQAMQKMQQELQQATQERDQLKGNRDLDMAKLALEDKKLELANQQQPDQALTPKDMAEARLKEAQAEKARADAEQTRVETVKMQAELKGIGVHSETDENGELMPVPPSEEAVLGQQTLAAVQQLAGYVTAPSQIVYGEDGRPVAVSKGGVTRPIIYENGQISGLQ